MAEQGFLWYNLAKRCVNMLMTKGDSPYGN